MQYEIRLDDDAGAFPNDISKGSAIFARPAENFRVPANRPRNLVFAVRIRISRRRKFGNCDALVFDYC